MWYGATTSNNSLWYKTMKAQVKLIRYAFSDLWPLAKKCINLQSSSRKWINLSNNSEVCHVLPYSLLSSQLWGSLEKLQGIIMVKTSTIYQPQVGGSEWSWNSFKTLFPENHYYLTCLWSLWKTTFRIDLRSFPVWTAFPQTHLLKTIRGNFWIL